MSRRAKGFEWPYVLLPGLFSVLLTAAARRGSRMTAARPAANPGPIACSGDPVMVRPALVAQDELAALWDPLEAEWRPLPWLAGCAAPPPELG